MTEPLDAELLKDLRGLGKPPSFDGNDAEYQRLSLQLPNPHEPRHSLSTVDGQMRSRTKSDLPGSRFSAGRCTFEVPHTDVLLVGFDHEKAVSELFVRSVEESNGAEAWRLIHSRHAPDTQNRQYASNAEDHDAFETLV